MKELLRKLPKVDSLSQCPEFTALREEYGEKAVTEAVHQVISALQQDILDCRCSALPTVDALYAGIQEQGSVLLCPPCAR